MSYIHDRWTSICHGNTPHIPDDSFDTSDLTMLDIASDEHIIRIPGSHLLGDANQAFYPMEGSKLLDLIKLTKILSGVLRDTW
jgi:hypothetical protein